MLSRWFGRKDRGAGRSRGIADRQQRLRKIAGSTSADRAAEMLTRIPR